MAAVLRWGIEATNTQAQPLYLGSDSLPSLDSEGNEHASPE